MLMDLHEILQAKAYAELLTESARLDYLKKTFGKRLEQKAENDPQIAALGIGGVDGETLVDKVLAWITNYDPSPNKQYGQWMVARYLKGDVMLEDMYRAAEYLTIFSRAKPRLEKKDINAYRSFQELFAAIQPFMDGEVEVSANQEKKAERSRMQSDDSVDVLYDGDDYLVITPKTKEASCYWGRGTQWCTAATNDNRFLSYNRDGPLFIIINRETGEKRQFHFESGQFMNETDTRIDLTKYLRENPKILDILGRERFVNIWNLVPLELWTNEDVKRVEAGKLAAHVKAFADLKKVPEEFLKDFEFAKAVVLSTYDQEIIRYFLSNKVLPIEFFDEQLPTHYLLLKALPPRFHTDERKIALVEAGCKKWNSIEENIPKPWPDEVEEAYWQSRIDDWGYWTCFADLPKKLQTPDRLYRLFRAKLGHTDPKRLDMLKRELPFLTKDTAMSIVRDAPAALFLFPDRLIMPQVVQATGEGLLKNLRKQNHSGEYMIYDGVVQRTAKTEIPKYMKKAPLGWWPAGLFPQLLEGDKAVKFSDIPDSRRTPEVVQAYLDHRHRGILDIPPKYLTREQVEKAIDQSDVIKQLDDSLIDEQMIVEKISAATDYSSLKWDDLPKRLQTDRVRKELYTRGRLDIKHIPPVALTVENIIARLKKLSSHTEMMRAEFEQIPNSVITPMNAVTMVENLNYLMKFMPDAVLSEALLNAYLSHYDRTSDAKYIEPQFKRFPRTMWSQRVVEKAVRIGLIAKKVGEVPKEYLNKEVAMQILANDAAQAGLIPADLLDEEARAEIVGANIDYLPMMSEDKVTEPVIYSAMKRWAHSQDQRPKAALLSIPREKWSRRVYAVAVGRIVTLKDVPRKWRDSEMIEGAVDREPFNLRFAADPVTWLNDHKDFIKRKSKDYWWNKKFEDAGFFQVGTGKNHVIIDVEDLEKNPLPNGGSIIFKMTGKTNLRVFFFDKKNKIVGRLYTEGGKIHMPNAQDMKPYRQMVLDAFHTHHELYNFDPNDLNALDFYYSSQSKYEARPLESIRRGKLTEKASLEWSNVIQGKGEIHVAWYNGKEVVRMFYGLTGAMFGKGTVKVQDFKIADLATAIKYSAEIYNYLKANRMSLGYGGSFLQIGILLNRDGTFDLLHGKLVGKIDGYSVWQGSNDRIAIFGPKGLIGHAKLTKNGVITNVQAYHSYNDQISLITSVFAAVQGKLAKK